MQLLCCITPSVREPAAFREPQELGKRPAEPFQISAETESALNQAAWSKPCKLSTQVVRQQDDDIVAASASTAAEPISRSLPRTTIISANTVLDDNIFLREKQPRQGSTIAEPRSACRNVSLSSLDSAHNSGLVSLSPSPSPVRPSDVSSGSTSTAAVALGRGESSQRQLPSQQRAASDPIAAPQRPHPTSSTPSPASRVPLTTPSPASRHSRAIRATDATPISTPSPSHANAPRLLLPVGTKVSVHSTWSALQTSNDPLARPSSTDLLAAMGADTTRALRPPKSHSAPASKNSWHLLTSLLRAGAVKDSQSDADDDDGATATTTTATVPALSMSLSGAASGGLGAWSRTVSGGGSLVQASLHRMHSIRHQQLLDAESGTATVSTSTARNGGVAGRSAIDGAAANTADVAEVACRTFADQFVKALLTGNATWGSLPEVGGVLDETCKMIAHDGQTYSGRAAIIRRLNKGMEQFLKLIGVEQGTRAETAAELAAKAGKVECSIDLVNLTRTAAASGGPGASSGGPGGLLLRLGSGSRGRSPGAGPGSGSSYNGLRSSAALAGSVVVATYTFSAGMRKFKLQDRFKVRHGLIVRLRRLRL